jgi:hypothetical protein
VTSYEFALRLNREVTDDELDALYEAGCGDAGFETGPLGAVADFDRESPSLAHAITSAARDIEKVPGLRAVGVQCDNMVNLAGIARRADVSREAVRLWSTGQRGPGGFPHAAIVSASGERLWDWLEVATWLERYRGDMRRPQEDQLATLERQLDELMAKYPHIRALNAMRTLRTADRVLAARDALMSEPDNDVREEFERLLEDA